MLIEISPTKILQNPMSLLLFLYEIIMVLGRYVLGRLGGTG
jgi:hypothetical protein